MKLRSIMLVSAALAFSVSTTASAQATDQSTTPAPQAKKKRDPNEIVCEKIEVLGSRLATQKICMTRAEWAQRQQDERMATDRVQVLRPCNGSAGC